MQVANAKLIKAGIMAPAPKARMSADNDRSVRSEPEPARSASPLNSVQGAFFLPIPEDFDLEQVAEAADHVERLKRTIATVDAHVQAIRARIVHLFSLEADRLVEDTVRYERDHPFPPEAGVAAGSLAPDESDFLRDSFAAMPEPDRDYNVVDPAALVARIEHLHGPPASATTFRENASNMLLFADWASVKQLQELEAHAAAVRKKYVDRLAAELERERATQQRM